MARNYKDYKNITRSRSLLINSAISIKINSLAHMRHMALRLNKCCSLEFIIYFYYQNIKTLYDQSDFNQNLKVIAKFMSPHLSKRVVIFQICHFCALINSESAAGVKNGYNTKMDHFDGCNFPHYFAQDYCQITRPLRAALNHF